MSTPTIRPQVTLKGVFAGPKTIQRRNFLRENKLHLKELERDKSQKQQHSDQQINQQHQHLYTDNRQRCRVRHKSLDLRPHSIQKGFACQQRVNSTCSSTTTEKTVATERGTRLHAKTELCDKGIQTDDIIDEIFLYEALSKCSLSEVEKNPINTLRKSDDQACFDTQQNYYGNTSLEPLKNNHQQKQTNNEFGAEKPTDKRPYSPITTKSKSSLNVDRTKRKSTGLKQGLADYKCLWLPGYLESEKREKVQIRQRELELDPDCPLGYYRLSEDERLSAIDIATKNFQSLVSELNHMPMTTETLRIRKRKVEIERELNKIEDNILIFSKPKVYVKS